MSAEREKVADGVKDSALYRIARNVGFNARVEPYWYAFDRLRDRMGFFERWREKRRLKRMAAEIRAGLAKQGVQDGSWEGREGKCVSNIRIAKTGLVAELQTFLRENAAGEAGKWRHLMAQRDRNSSILPLEFDEPFEVEGGSVTSAARLAAELAEVNRALRIDETFALAKARKVDYVDATEKDISVYESKFGTIEGFWAKFAYVMLKKLADTSVERKLPVMFA
ncbi:MAG: hypothetical protein HYY17_14520 [Planctomycetes bacterium]|nr:hypothetical protein [Planctomycetota bacterium]